MDRVSQVLFRPKATGISVVGVRICRLQPVRIHELDKGRGNLISKLGYTKDTLYGDTSRTWHRQHRIHHRIILVEGFQLSCRAQPTELSRRSLIRVWPARQKRPQKLHNYNLCDATVHSSTQDFWRYFGVLFISLKASRFTCKRGSEQLSTTRALCPVHGVKDNAPRSAILRALRRLGGGNYGALL